MIDDCGKNPMRWDCNKGGAGMNCFNKKRRPKIEIFAECFPGLISFGDIDGIVEINGQGLLLEWKSDLMNLPRGQYIMYRNLTTTGYLSVIVVIGNAETMEISHMGQFYLGSETPLKEATIDDVKDKIKWWVDGALKRVHTEIIRGLIG